MDMGTSDKAPERQPASLLFVYGPSGAGKTRLLQRLDQTLEGVQGVMRRGCEQILDEMVQSVYDRSFDAYFERYCNVDNLLVDNLWILQSRPRSALVVGRLVGERIDRGNLTVLASDLSVQDVISSIPAIGQYLNHKCTRAIAIQAHGRRTVYPAHPLHP